MLSATRQRFKYVLSDYLMLNLGWLLFTLVRYLVLPESYRAGYSFVDHLSSTPVWAGQIVIPLVMLGLYWLSGYYNVVFFKSRIDEAVNTAGVSVVGALVIFFAVLINDGVPERLHNIEMICILWLCLLVPVYILRVIITGKMVKRIRTRQIAFNTLVVGTGSAARDLVAKMDSSERGNGMRIVGYVETNPGRVVLPELDRPVYKEEEIQNVIEEQNIRRIIVVPHHNGARQTIELVNALLPLDVDVYVTPDLYSLIVMRPRIGDVVGEPLINISTPAVPEMTQNCKRLADVCLSAVALMVLSPLLLTLALVVRTGSKGSVLYRQERVGYRKQPFNILKFRTMYVNAEEDGPALSTADDKRITPVGRVLRKYRLDELPQFWNVIRGDMSLVGPRPERQYYISQIVKRAPYYTLVHRVRPGITSWGMVKYGYASTLEQMIERLRYDLIYLENVSLVVDIKILFHTVNTVIRGKGL